MNFSIQILGCGSATPTLQRNPTAQVINLRERYFLIDCGEGTQLQLRKYGIKFQRIDHIFISHLHGDHYFGLVGFISTLHLLGRKKDLNIYGPSELKEIILSQLRASKSYLSFHIEFHDLVSKKSELIFEDEFLTISTIPLKHRIYCNGFLIKEKQHQHRIAIEKIKNYKIPIAWYHRLKKGEHFSDNGLIIPVEKLTHPPYKQRSYAFCSDTAYYEPIIKIIENADLLYHEATFLESHKERAKQTFHSTAKQAATIAKKANVKQLLIGHYSARYKSTEEFISEGKLIFKNITAAEDGVCIKIPLQK